MDQNQKPSVNFTLNNGMNMPLFGLGTYQIDDENTFIEAIKIGYRLFDSASFYKNEESLGKAIQKAIAQGLVKREELFITTKVWNDEKDDCEKALSNSLQRLGLDYVDLYLIHWPIGYYDDKGNLKQQPLHKTWAVMEDLVQKKMTRSIGISNFNVQLLLDLLTYAKIKPVVNQVELHPYLAQKGLVETFNKFGVVTQSYSSFGRLKNDVLQNQLIKELAQKYKKSEGQIILNWLWENQIGIIPKSCNPERLKQNFEFDSFRMEAADLKKIDDLDTNKRMNALDDVFNLKLFA